MENEYEFLDLSDLDDTGRNEINAILKSRPASDILKLPWDIGETSYECPVVEEQIQEAPKVWQNYDTNADTMKYENPTGMAQAVMVTPIASTNPYNSHIPTVNSEWAMQNIYMTNMPHEISSYQCVYSPSMYAGSGNENQDMAPAPHPPNIRPESGKRISRGRGKQRGDNFNNRNIAHNNEMHIGYMQEHSQYTSLSMYPPVYYHVANPSQQHPVTGPPIYFSQAPYPAQIHQPSHPMHSNYSRFHHAPNNNVKYARQSQSSVLPQTNGEVILPRVNNAPFVKDRSEKYRSPNSRMSKPPFRLPSEEDNNSSQTNIITTSNVKSSIEQHTSTLGEHSVPVSKKLLNNEKKTSPVLNAKVEHNTVSAINNTGNNDFAITQNGNNAAGGEESETNAYIVEKSSIKDEKSREINEVPHVETTAVVITTSTSVAKISEDIASPIVTPVVKQKEEESSKTQNQQTTCQSKEEMSSQLPVSVVSTPVVQSNTWASICKKRNSSDNYSTTITMTTTTTTVSSTIAALMPSSMATSTTTTSSTKPIARIMPLNVTTATNADSSESHVLQKYTTTQGTPKSKSDVSVPKNTNQESSPRDTESHCSQRYTISRPENYCDDPMTYRMGEFLLSYQMDKQTVSLLPRGLTNRSNYCYINSILQALLACPPFYNLLMALPHSKNVSRKNSITPLIDNMIKFVHEFTPLADGARISSRKDRIQKRSEDSVTDIQCGVPFEPVYVYTMLKNTSASGIFPIEGRQEDAEEFLSCLLNGISDEMLELMKLANNDNKNAKEETDPTFNHSQGEEEWKVMGPKNKGSVTRCTEFGRTPLSDIFRGQLRSRVMRAGYEPVTDNVQPFFTLQLDIEKAGSVEEALEILVGKDQVEGMTCSKTKQQIEAWKQVFLEELPVILILHLKWFDYKVNGCSKIVKNVEFPITLKLDNKFMSPLTVKKFSQKQKQYKLFAVTYHDGKEASKGHYVTDAFHVGYGGWVRYDDSSLKGVPEGNVLNPLPPRVPYLLYYRRQDTIGNNQATNAKSR